MDFMTAVRSVVQQHYADFNGRARRSEYWWFFLFNFILSAVAYAVDAAIGAPVLRAIVFLALIVPGLAVAVRRLHDTGRSGWWLLIAFVPLVGFIVLLVFFVSDSQGQNQYGPSPKQIGGGYSGYGGYPPPQPY